MSVHVLGEVPIKEVEQFVAVFGQEGLAKRREHGCLGSQVFTPVEGAGTVMVLLEFGDREAFDGFRNDPTAPAIMRLGGAQGPPTFRVLQQVARFEG